MKTFQDNKTLILMLAALAAVFIWSAINPYDWGVWIVEMTSVFVVFLALVFTYRKFQFSNAAYFIVSLWLIMHTIGAHYSFELVPFGLVTDTFGFERNHYDRVAHFVIGLNAFGVAEFFWRKKLASSRKAAAFVGVCFIMAMANAWELIEWAYAEIDGGDVGAAFLGSQGDVWDAQKDMLCDTIGALCSVPFFLWHSAKKISP
jgi:putative membrane protein